MQNFENSTPRVKCSAFIDYKPAELKLGKDWIIVYYAKNPVSNQLERFRLRVPVIKSNTERLKHAKKIVVGINDKLLNGWSPFMEESGKNYKSFSDVVAMFKKTIDKHFKDDILRYDTVRSYKSNCNLLEEFVKTKQKITFAIEINRFFCVEYLSWIYEDRNSSPKTRNNHLNFIKRFCTFLLDKGVLSENPANGIKPLKLLPKTRQIFTVDVESKIHEHLNQMKNGFPVLCRMINCCFIRNTELSKLRVCMINLSDNTIHIPASISKNKKSESVTIPSYFLPELEIHIKNADPNYFVFSNDNFMSGSKPMASRKIATEWGKMKKHLKLGKEHQFYSFKDSGITALLNSGVPAIKVRDQARHGEIRMTENYTPRNQEADNTIKNSVGKI